MQGRGRCNMRSLDNAPPLPVGPSAGDESAPPLGTQALNGAGAQKFMNGDIERASLLGQGQ
eukprot:8987418-Pyramimonas_sp.AAC.1